jgi:site-specific DNA-adenine methylase
MGDSQTNRPCWRPHYPNPTSIYAKKIQKKTQSKKTGARPEGRRPRGTKYIFKPADSPQFQNGAGTGDRGSWSTSLERSRPRLWAHLPGQLAQFAERLREVVLECDDYEPVLRRYDSPKTLFYLDPPYVGVEGQYYSANHDAGFDHIRLREVLNTIQGSVVISYYDHPVVRDLYQGWRIVCKLVTVDAGAVKRSATELLIVHESTYAHLHPRDIFAEN